MVSGIVAQTEAAGNQIIEKHCGNIRVRSSTNGRTVAPRFQSCCLLSQQHAAKRQVLELIPSEPLRLASRVNYETSPQIGAESIPERLLGSNKVSSCDRYM